MKQTSCVYRTATLTFGVSHITYKALDVSYLSHSLKTMQTLYPI